MIRLVLLALASILVPAQSLAQEPVAALEAPAPPHATTRVVMTTEMGDIVIALETERAPVSAGNFLRYVDARRFDGIVFYRAMKLDWGDQPNGLIQGGTQNEPRRLFPPIAHEPTSQTGVKHTVGAISMARNAPGTATGDFSIMLAPQPGLDADPAGETEDQRLGYAAFGQVVDGMAVVRAIFDAPVDPDKGEGWMKGQMLTKPVRVLTVRRAEPPAP
jgi:peptidyl-prolyl cis-trans isomerase A (cyclophilin A)